MFVPGGVGADGDGGGGTDAGAHGAGFADPTGTGATGPRAGDSDASGASASGASVSGSGVSVLAAALDGLLGEGPGGWSDADLAAAMVELRRQQARLAAVVADATAAFDARQVHAADGARSAADWIAVQARIPRGQAGREVREARRLRAMPATRTAFRAGDINPAHTQVLCRLAGHPRAAVHFPDGEADLVDHARALRFDDWQQVTDHWLAGADPDGPEHKRERDQDLRRFAVPVGLDGVGHPDGYLTPLAAETVNEALARIERELFEADWNTARELHGNDVTTAHLARTAGQRRHDALVEMAIRAMTAPADGQRPAPLLTVMVDYPTLAGRVCQLAGTGTVIAPGDITALLALDETLIERVVFDGPNRVRDISTSRTFRGTLRRALEITHPRCDHPTCHVPAKNCQADHITPWSHGGPTTQANGRMACAFHNRLWYHHPHHAPPPPTTAPPNTDTWPPDTWPPDTDDPDRDPRDVDAPDDPPATARPPRPRARRSTPSRVTPDDRCTAATPDLASPPSSPPSTTARAPSQSPPDRAA